MNILVCPSGSYLNPNNNDRCEICPVNTYNPDTNSATCTECQTGRDTQQQTGQTSVDSCGKYWNNVYMKNNVTTQTFVVICETAISDTIRDIRNRFKAVVEMKDRSNITYVNLHTVCSAGSYINGDVCDRCPINTYSNGLNSASCENCPTGTNTQGEIGRSSRFACGSYKN